MFNLFKKKTKRIYFDHASATRVRSSAVKKYLESFKIGFANPSSIHLEGEGVKVQLHEARRKVSKVLHTKSQNVYFTSSTTEANNIFIKGVVLECFKNNRPCEVVYSESDHSSIVDVVNGCKLFKARCVNVNPLENGVIPHDEILKVINENTKLVCFSLVNSETGTLQDVKNLASKIRSSWMEKGYDMTLLPKIYVDATQAIKYFGIDVNSLGVDGLSFGVGKVGGVSGCAVLYVKTGTKLTPLISGGGQEEGVRSGTENVGAIVSAASTLEEVMNPVVQKQVREKMYKLRNYCISKLEENFKDEELKIFGDRKFKYNKYYEHSAPHIILVSLRGMLGEELCLRLDAKGISVSPATACSLLENSGSNFLRSIGEPVIAKETIRISFDESNTEVEVDFFVKTLTKIRDSFI